MDQLTGFQIAMLVSAGIYLLVCGGFGAYVADQKGRSGLEGFLFGLILGPIGIVAIGTMPTLERTVIAIEEEEGEDIGHRIAEQYQPRPQK
jgi:hypothetical protein